MTDEQRILEVLDCLRRMMGNMERRIRALEALTKELGTEEQLRAALAILKSGEGV